MALSKTNAVRLLDRLGVHWANSHIKGRFPIFPTGFPWKRSPSALGVHDSRPFLNGARRLHIFLR